MRVSCRRRCRRRRRCRHDLFKSLPNDEKERRFARSPMKKKKRYMSAFEKERGHRKIGGSRSLHLSPTNIRDILRGVFVRLSASWPTKLVPLPHGCTHTRAWRLSRDQFISHLSPPPLLADLAPLLGFFLLEIRGRRRKSRPFFCSELWKDAL